MLNRKKSAGLSLIELMIAMVLGLLLLGVVIQLFSGTRLTYSSNEALARAQEAGRFAVETLRLELRDLDSNGFCAGDTDITSHLDTSCDTDVEAMFNQNAMVRGWDYRGSGTGAGTGIGEAFEIPTTLAALAASDADNWASQEDGGALDLPAFLHGQVAEGSDVLLIRSMRRLDVDVSATGAITDAATITLETTPTPDVPESRLLLITDCQGNADLFRQSASISNRLAKPDIACSSPQPGNIAPATSPWSLFGDPSGYSNSAQVFEAVTRAYYVGISDATGEPALFQIDPLAAGSSGDPLRGVELVSGVENLQVLYGVSGIDNGRAVEQWLPAHQVPNWNLVIAARVAVIVRSNARADASAVQEQFFSTGTAITTPADSRLRREYSTVVALRNRVVVGEFL